MHGQQPYLVTHAHITAQAGISNTVLELQHGPLGNVRSSALAHRVDCCPLCAVPKVAVMSENVGQPTLAPGGGSDNVSMPLAEGNNICLTLPYLQTHLA
jgi:hypothetical protein